ncbi:lysylphosphatidylglycerol synthase transmembrane domain-containing protein [Virgisporangium ochraceum]|nr:lysylphosphatidylglycerol synthase transmembrane domain-containing protein [Virgisporangium ochraceum]
MLVGVGILGVLLHRLGEGAFLDGLRVIEPTTLLAAVGIGVLTTVFSAWRWCLAARGIGIALPMRTAVADYYQSLFLNATLPGGLLGDVNRAVQNGRSSGSVGRGIRAVVLERSAGQITLFLVGAVVLVAYPSMLLAASDVVTVPGPALAAAGATLAATAFAVTRARRPHSRVGRAVRTMTSDVRQGLLARRTWPGVVVSSAIVLGGHLATFLLAARAAGATAPLLKLLPFAVLALVAMTLPLSIGGWGPREGVTAWAFGAAGLGAAEGLTTAVVYGLFAFAAAMPGVAVLVARWIVRLRRTPAPVDAAPADPAPIGSAAVDQERLPGDAGVGPRAEVDDRSGHLVGV